MPEQTGAAELPATHAELADTNPAKPPKWVRATLGERSAGAVITLTCLAVLAAAVYVRPPSNEPGALPARGLGLPPCGFQISTGWPCPSCGMTTAFAYTVRGQFVSAALVQPAGFALALATIAGVFLSGYVAISGWRPTVPRIVLMYPLQWAYAVGGLFILGWAFKMALGWWTGELPRHY